MKKLIVANWKNHPDSLAEAEGILEFSNNFLESLDEKKELSLIFCPPFVFTEEIGKKLKLSHLEQEASLGAQNLSVEDYPALTGEVSGQMLKKLGVQYVIIGHSERRWKLGESDDIVNKKLKSALKYELVPIVCIGEKEKNGDSKMFIQQQVKRTFNGLDGSELSKCIIAYEPVWAISTNPGALSDNPQNASGQIRLIRNTIIENWKLDDGGGPRFLYGGSVNSKNICEFLKENDIDGVLVGSASVNKEEFVKILDRASKL
jgi:triosephosphate isomerase (TIM)